MQGKQKGQLSTWLASAHCRLMANLYNGNILLYNYNDSVGHCQDARTCLANLDICSATGSAARKNGITFKGPRLQTAWCCSDPGADPIIALCTSSMVV
jgi:hypothetical protein